MPQTKQLSKDQVKQIIQNRPSSVSPEDVVQGLLSKGYQLEGYQGNSIMQKPINNRQEVQSIASNVMSGLSNAGKLGVADYSPEQKAKAQQMADDAKKAQAMAGGIPGAIVDIGKSTIKATGEGAVNALNTFADVVDPIAKPLGIIKDDGGASRQLMQQGREAINNAPELKASTIPQEAADVAGNIAAYMAPGLAVSKLAKLLPGGGFIGSLFRGTADIAGQAGLAAVTARPEDRAGAAIVAGGLTGGAKIVGSLYRGLKGMINPGAEKLITSGVKPTGNKAAVKNFDSDLKLVLKDPDIVPAAKEIAKSDNPLITFRDKLRAGLKNIWGQVQGKLDEATASQSTEKIVVKTPEYLPAEVGTKTVPPHVDLSGYKAKVFALRKNYPVLARNHPEVFDALEQQADTLSQQRISFEDSESMIEELNANLKKTYNMTGTDRSTLMRSDPEVAANIILADELRGGLDNAIDGFSELKRRYAAMRNVLNHVENRIPIVDRQNVTSLAQQVSSAHSIGQAGVNLVTGRPFAALASLGEMGMANLIKELESSGNKVARAFGLLLKSGKIGGPSGLSQGAIQATTKGAANLMDQKKKTKPKK